MHSGIANHQWMNLATVVYRSLSLPGNSGAGNIPQKTFIGIHMSSTMSGDASLTLPTALTIRNISAVRELILDSLNNKSTTILDIDGDAQVDLSFVQLVTAARKQAEAQAARLVLARPAAGDLYDVLKRGGFLDEMTPDAAHFWLHQEKN
ncbi:STAS domain-containing protein [Shinella curvata]|uniref:STAS domain-containing protein n=1 Tax=Shinella curvata TaxID=1817964 RepID=A0ABT8XI17_9HYPH|nr:STAS domain-containing protein [Shinella curvata]MCJ8056015.1 STAS domain-containing protein [Shinella curvata]MDO6123384.1 STAS domain-containing protein [Shinella curvata]